MATSGKDREARERARVYQARQKLHDDQGRRRRRDNLLAGVIGGAVILGILGAQAAYFVVGPGAPEPVAVTCRRPRPTLRRPPTPPPTDGRADRRADADPGPDFLTRNPLQWRIGRPY